VGTHSLTAIATDNQSGTKTSAAVSITVTNPNLEPIVSITSPSSGGVFNEGDVVTIAVDADDADGTITLVEYYINGVKVGLSSSEPHTFQWLATEGNHTISTVVTDNQGGATTSNVTITVNADPLGILESQSTGYVYVYPNPIQIDSKITVSLKESSETSLKVFDQFGREVLHIAEGHLSAGTHSFTLDSEKFSSGLYLIKLINGQKNASFSIIKP
jgi:hypothetical protein